MWGLLNVYDNYTANSGGVSLHMSQVAYQTNTHLWLL